ncbi:MAG: hypothetical protein MNSN_01160 [Minisyncoccus archaeiphilus]|jgi:DnaK suppressor protein|uniref:TraR/DksA family transcriptional regulator n=1 Tax=Minisyncoccus archaeiphilus TaxID=3238481 RepID=UPI0009D04CB3|nr:MAG: RNA polymerase-binding transcription factor DksA [Parcubacteria group bacterium ADurb.Bin216]GMX59121.1 MAG: hypothetical protein MNSN_01160 [Candidatus Parcubacteria bacterium]
MNQEKQEELKQKLLESKTSIEKELSTFATKEEGSDDWNTTFPHEDNCDDIECETDEVEEYENLLPIEHSLELRLKDIDHALQKLEKGEYGFCEQCHQEIEIERLEILPDAKTCNQCKI